MFVNPIHKRMTQSCLCTCCWCFNSTTYMSLCLKLLERSYEVALLGISRWRRVSLRCYPHSRSRNQKSFLQIESRTATFHAQPSHLTAWSRNHGLLGTSGFPQWCRPFVFQIDKVLLFLRQHLGTTPAYEKDFNACLLKPCVWVAKIL